MGGARRKHLTDDNLASFQHQEFLKNLRPIHLYWSLVLGGMNENVLEEFKIKVSTDVTARYELSTKTPHLTELARLAKQYMKAHNLSYRLFYEQRETQAPSVPRSGKKASDKWTDSKTIPGVGSPCCKDKPDGTVLNAYDLFSQHDLSYLPDEKSGAFDLSTLVDKLKNSRVPPEEVWWKGGPQPVQFSGSDSSADSQIQLRRLVTIDNLMKNFIPHYLLMCESDPECQAWMLEKANTACAGLLEGLDDVTGFVKVFTSTEGKSSMSAGVLAVEAALNDLSRRGSAVRSGCVAVGWVNEGWIGRSLAFSVSPEKSPFEFPLRRALSRPTISPGSSRMPGLVHIRSPYLSSTWVSCSRQTSVVGTSWRSRGL